MLALGEPAINSFVSVTGHFRIAKELAGDTLSAIDIGCKDNSLAAIDLDIDFTVKPTIVGSVLELPIKSASFEKVFFMEAIEHLPKKTELLALTEIKRILKPNGFMILTTPHHHWYHTWLDLAYWLKGHRHYQCNQILLLLKKTGFEIEHFSVRGDFAHLLTSLFYYFITKPLGFNIPNWLLNKEDMGYDRISPNGAAIIVKARRIK